MVSSRQSWSGEAPGRLTANVSGSGSAGFPPRAGLDAKPTGDGTGSAAAAVAAGGEDRGAAGMGTNGGDSSPPPQAGAGAGDGRGSAASTKAGKGVRGGGVPRGDGKAGGAGGEAGDWSALPTEFMAADLSRIFRASQEKVEETLTAGCFYR